MPVNTRSWNRTGNSESDPSGSESENNNTTTKPSFNLPHLTKFSGYINGDPDGFFMLFEHLTSLQQWDDRKKGIIINVSSRYNIGFSFSTPVTKLNGGNYLQSIEGQT